MTSLAQSKLRQITGPFCWPMILLFSIHVGESLAQQKREEPVILSGNVQAERIPVNLDWWERIRKNGINHGFHHYRRISISKDRRTVVSSSRESEVERVVLRRAMKEFTKVQYSENESGVLQSFRFRQLLRNKVQQEVVGNRVNDTLEIVFTAHKNRTRKTIRLPREIRSEFFPQHDILQRPLENNETRRYKIFQAENQTIVTQRWQADRPRFVKLPDGSRRKLLKVRVSDSGQPGLTRYVYLDTWGKMIYSRIVERDQTVFTTLRLDEHQKENLMLASIEKRLKPVLFLQSLKELQNLKEVSYRLTYFGNSFPVKLPVSQNQQVVKVNTNSRDLDLSIADLSGIQQVGVRSPAISPASRLLDFKHRTISTLTRKATPIVTVPAGTAFQLEKYLFQNMKLTAFSPEFQPASEVAKMMQGDSTEYATLLAAMLRTSRIPSRIAFGLRHSPRNKAFVVHFWTEAWLRGKWFPLDATRGKSGITLDYIKLGDSTLDDSVKLTDLYRPFLELLPQLQIQVVEKEKVRR